MCLRSKYVDHSTDTLEGRDTFHGLGIISCSILPKELLDKRVKQIPTILKRKTIERNDSIKLHCYEEKIAHSLSKMIPTPLKDIKEKIAVFKTVLNMDLLWHTSGIFNKAERQRPRPNWNGFMDQFTSEKTNVPLQCYHWFILTQVMKAAYIRHHFI